MPDHDFTVDIRDIRFVLFEQLPFAQLRDLEPFKELEQDEVGLLLDECYKFNRSVLAPINRVGDREGCGFADGKVTVPTGFREAYRAFCENGWLGVSSSEEAGGMGLPQVIGAATTEMSIGACCSLALSIGLTKAAASLLEVFGSDEMKETYLPKLLSGTWQGTMCLTEPQAGSAVGDIKTMGKRDGDAWLLTGTKSFITAGDHDMCENHVHLVLARTPDAPKGFKGISLFLVPKYLPGPDGGVGEFNDVACAGIEHKMGIKGSPTCTMTFGDNERCRAFLIGEEGKGLQYMFHMMNEARIGVGLQGMSLGAAAYQYALAYAAERVQGVPVEQMKDPDAPRVTINEHPDVRRMLLFCKSVCDGTRALLLHVSFLADVAAHHPDSKKRERAQGVVDLLTPVCKAYVSDIGFEVTRWALQVLGGYGYVSEYPVEQHLRDEKIASIYEGTNGIQALDLLGRKLPAKGGMLFMAFASELHRFVQARKDHPTLAPVVKAFADELTRWQDVTTKLAGMGMSGDQRYPVLSATTYLEMTGHLVTAWMLVTQATVAHEKLQAIYAEQGVTDEDGQARVNREHPEATFYANKIAGARFFVHHVLVRNQGIAAEIISGDRSPLELVL